jgi:hypothetical protein
MILYHGANLSVEKPCLSFSRTNVDFGKGFYTTPIKDQAAGWAERFKRKRGQSVVSAYELDETALRKNTSVLEFDAYSNEWLDFISSCRRGEEKGPTFDIIIGGVANDKVFDVIELYFDNLIDKAEAIKRLRYEKPNLQYCFKNQQPRRKRTGYVVLVRYLTQGTYLWFRPKRPEYVPFATNQPVIDKGLRFISSEAL